VSSPKLLPANHKIRKISERVDKEVRGERRRERRERSERHTSYGDDATGNINRRNSCYHRCYIIH
jgi:hypothetical protein